MSEVEMRNRGAEERNANRGDNIRLGPVQENRLLVDHAQEQQRQNERAGSRNVLQRIRDVLLCRAATEVRQVGGQEHGQPMAANDAIYGDLSDVRRVGGEYGQPGDHLATGDTMEFGPKATASEKGAKAINQDTIKKSWAERNKSAAITFGALGVVGLAGLVTSIWALVNTLDVPTAQDDVVEVDFKPKQTIEFNVLANDVPAASFDLLDYSSLQLVGADAGSDGRVKTVTGVGTWTASGATGEIVFKPDDALMALPVGGVAVQYTVKWAKDPASLTVKMLGPATLTIVQKGMAAATKTPAPTTTAGGQPAVMDFFQIVKKGSVFKINFNEIIKDFSSLSLDAASIQLFDEVNKVETGKLDVANQGTYTVSATAAGVVDFQPAAGFADFPAPVMMTIANTAKVRSKPFKVSFKGVVVPTAGNVPVFEDLPVIDFDSKTPVAGQLPGVIPAGFATVTVTVVGTKDKPGSATAGGLPLDPASVELVGPVSMDGSMPVFRFNPPTSKKEMSVDGEGVWDVSNTGDIIFRSANNFVRWPTAVGYTVKDTDGNISNIGLIEINPKLRKLQEGVKDFLTKSDDDFWAEFSTKVIHSAEISNDGPGLKEIRLLVHTLWATAYLSLTMTTRTLIYSQARYLEADYAKMKMAWMSSQLSKSGLLSATAVVTDATTKLQGVPLGTRLIRLEIIRRLITEVYPPDAT